MKQTLSELNAKLNQETGRLTWSELERHFARGALIWVSGQLDLVEVAAAMAADDKAVVQQWLTEHLLGKAGIEEARRWHETQPEFWAVVTAPWVLIQEISAGRSG
ncbi:DUF2288 domain-containing protein [Methylococcus sp. EFPC2]|uniref:DUF2288 domain-containing protein n=1 Tax=Methylococcus sp. EFPC2 TaxID=2812648 RepID=UPI0019673883|nr:DUF2288 domain-containing protein [Methylococcus sp. EFPC2]QSA98919.1 DUF2288 domain-containing protein [Methylococcus sp. EFPC2]